MNEMVQQTMQLYNEHKGEDLVFITITIKPKLYKYQSITQYEITVNDIEQCLTRFTVKSTYSVELTKDGNVHYHAISKFRDKLNRIHFINATRKNRSLGFIKITNPSIESIDQLQRAAIYLCKDLETTQKVLHKNGWKPELLKNIE